MFDSQAPLHEVWRMECAIGHSRYRNWRKTTCGIRKRRCARKLALRKPETKSLICGHSCVDGAVGYSGRDCHAADGAKQTSLEGLHVRWIGSDEVRHAARQNVAENAEARFQHRFRFELPRDCSSRLQDGQRCRREHIAEMSLDGGVQGLIDIMRNRIE